MEKLNKQIKVKNVQISRLRKRTSDRSAKTSIAPQDDTPTNLANRDVANHAKSGAETEDLYVSNAWFMDALMFLRDQETPAHTINTFSDSDDTNKSEKQESSQVSFVY